METWTRGSAHEGVLTTSFGRKLRIVKLDTPKNGETYLRPNGVRGVYNVLIAVNNFKRHSYIVVKEI